MIIYHENGTITAVIWDRNKPPMQDSNQSYIEIDELSANIPTLLNLLASVNIDGTASLFTVVNNELYYQGAPAGIVKDIDRGLLKSEYLNMIARLEQIQNAGVIPFTQAGFNQVVQAVKDEALYIERVMKVIKAIVT